MKVLFLNTGDTNGGAARAAVRIMRGVRQCGVDAVMFVKSKTSSDEHVVSLSLFVPTGRLHSFFDWCASKVKNKWQHHKWRPYKKSRSPLYLSDLRSTRIYGALQKQNYDILHLHWFNERFLDICELKKVEQPIVWTLHDSWAFTGVCHVPYSCKKYQTHCGRCPMLGSGPEKDLAYEVFYKKSRAYKGLDLHIVTPSRWLADCVKKSELLGQFPVSVIPNCLDTELFAPQDKKKACEALKLDPSKTYILYGAMQATKDPNKGFSELRSALGLIKEKLQNTELLVFGSNEDYDTLELPTSGKMFGYVKDDPKMVALYNAADVTVVPSLSENLSNTIMESLSCGTPVVAFNIGGNSDMIDHLANGYLAKDVADMAVGIELCLHSTGVFSGAARKKVMENYTVEIVSKRYMDLYNSLL